MFINTTDMTSNAAFQQEQQMCDRKPPSRRVRSKHSHPEHLAPTLPIYSEPEISLVNNVEISETKWTDDDLALMALLKPALDEHVIQEGNKQFSTPANARIGQQSCCLYQQKRQDILAPLEWQYSVSNDRAWRSFSNEDEVTRGSSHQEQANQFSSSISNLCLGEGSVVHRKRERDEPPIQDIATSSDLAIISNDSSIITESTDEGPRNVAKNQDTIISSMDQSVYFYPSQSGGWKERFAELKQYRKKNGHCRIPNHWPENPALALWVKRQRYQFKLQTEGKHSTMTKERQDALNSLGFVWDLHGAIWEERYSELCAFKAEKGHCNVPANWSDNRQLAVWVKCQRRQYVLLQNGKPSNSTPERIARLESVGFVFCPRSIKS